ncbi:hypothetical protein AGMMS49546_11880 [Spirochaetia bacterium]|nr:hypothetical protein AGMMS49546_11880 [Spirochaetia bacterium]
MAMNRESHKYEEVLDIENFLTIKKFRWTIKEFNVITGEMGSGKSLCMKLLYFFEQIFVSSIFFAPAFSKQLFENGNFFERLSRNFEKNFFLNYNNYNLTGLKVTYSYTNTTTAFAISVKWNSGEKKLEWESEYFLNNLQKWAGYFGDVATPDTTKMVKGRIWDDVKHDFFEQLPIATMFIPASRAVLAMVKKPSFDDSFLSDFWDDKDFLMTNYPSLGLSSDKANILHVNNIKKIKMGDEYDIHLEHNDGRIVPLLYSSSGQQELVYLLLLMEKLPQIQFLYGDTLSFFIEEPSAHLFPKEQKELIESIINLFRKEKAFHKRFFITTHSPYILNVINNAMEKGRLQKAIDTLEEGELKNNITRMYEELSFPYLLQEEISAYFIEAPGDGETGNVSSMISDDDPYLYAHKIEEITQSIYKDANAIQNIFNEIDMGKK